MELFWAGRQSEDSARIQCEDTRCGCLDEDILCAKVGRHVPDNSRAISDPEEIEKQ